MKIKKHIKVLTHDELFELWTLLSSKETEAVACVVFYDDQEVELTTFFVNKDLFSNGLVCADIFKDIEDLSNLIRMDGFKKYAKEITKFNKPLMNGSK